MIKNYVTLVFNFYMNISVGPTNSKDIDYLEKHSTGLFYS